MTRPSRAALALACLTLLAGCAGGPGHERDRLSVGLSLFSVPLVSVVEIRHEWMSEDCAAAGDRLSVESGPSPFSFLGLGRGVHLIDVRPGGSAPPQHPPRSESSDMGGSPNVPGDGAGAARRPDPRTRR
mgnify:CR=1 FL=1